MALIACSECGKQISDRAVVCPSCGNPIAAQSTTPIPVSLGDEVVTTQQTGKFWKAVSIAGAVMMVIGIGSCVSGSGNAFSGMVWLIVGGVVFLGGRLCAWWSHG